MDVTSQKYHPGDHYSMNPTEIHTISVRPKFRNVFAIFQYRTHLIETNLWVPGTLAPKTEGLYRKPKSTDIIRMTEQALDSVGNLLYS